jgi:hypothetical protein
MAIEAISREQTMTAIADKFNCSRTTVHEQKNRALNAVTSSFEEAGEGVLFTIPVTREFIRKVVVALFLICGSSYRGIVYFLSCIFGYHIALGSVFNILDGAADNATQVNESYDLSTIKTSAADELFHRNAPILGVVDIPSRFCALLAKADDRDHHTWEIHLYCLQQRGYAPVCCIIDEAKGMTKGYELVLPDTKLRYDHFHFIRDLKDVSRFLKNGIASQTTQTLKLFQRAEKAQDEQKQKTWRAAFTLALTELSALEETYKTFQTLSPWLQYDVLQLAGHPPAERAMLYDFIVTEMERLAAQHPHRISAIVISLHHRRTALLDVADALNTRFAELATLHKVSLNSIWAVCYITRYGMESCHYHEESARLETEIGNQYEAIEDAVLTILGTTHRCSSMIENLNSRVRPYLDERKSVSQKILSLIQFYLNHKPFTRSLHDYLKDKTPAEVLTGKPHKPWLDMLGFNGFQAQPA